MTLPIYSNSEKGDGNPHVSRRHWMKWSPMAILGLLSLWYLVPQLNSSCMTAETFNPDGLCPLVEKVSSKQFAADNSTVFKLLNDEEYAHKVLTHLSGAVQIPTEIYDDMPNPKYDSTPKEMYKAYSDFHDFLKETYPLIYEHLKVETVNEYGLVITWEGSESDLQPLMLCAHIDVVPVQKETIKDWTYSPFSGHIDKDFVWGRGASDCKSLLISLMETFELLLKEDFSMKRTTILAFGYDEEASGSYGAYEIGQFLLERYGSDSIYAIIDEGSMGFIEEGDTKFICPDTGEKGYLDAIIELTTPGGHSSVPPKHTSIGIIGELLVEIEKHPFEPMLTNVNPFLKRLQCVALYSNAIDEEYKKDILKAHLDANANERVVQKLSLDESVKFTIETSQAIDIIKGGAKSNALPEHVEILVNHRIAVESSFNEVADKVLGHLYTIANIHGLGIIREGVTFIEPTSKGYFNFSYMDPLAVAPVTPVDGPTWETFAGSLRHFYEDIIFPGTTDEFVVTPGLSTGNTDTKSYWDLTRHIYRYTAGIVKSATHIHSVDERVDAQTPLQTITFFYEYLHILNE